jgi:hypothetical protein
VAENAIEHVLVANQAIADGRFEEGLALLTQVIATDDGPPKHRALYLRARVLSTLKRPVAEQSQAWEEFVQRVPQNAYDRVARAQAMTSLASLQYVHERTTCPKRLRPARLSPQRSPRPRSTIR